MATAPVTPMMEQYNAIKKLHPDKILFFRLGDFYEMFHDDAVEASQLLGLTLTSRSKGDAAVPMAGIPYHAAERYIEQLLAADRRVVICDQVEDPALAKGLVKRDITRVVTPGTVVEDAFLDARINNFIAACALLPDGSAGLAWADLSTGEFLLEEPPAAILADSVERLSPAECLISDDESGPKLEAMLKGRAVGLRSRRPSLDFSSAAATVKGQFGVASLDGFGLRENSPSLGPAAALLKYLDETQRGMVKHLRHPRLVDSGEFLSLDRASQRNLELFEPLSGGPRKATVVGVMDHSRTSAGGRLLRQWLLRPLAKLDLILRRQEAVRAFLEDHLRRGETREVLGRVADIERILGRIGCNRASARDLSALGLTLAALPALVESLKGAPSTQLKAIIAALGGWEGLAERINNSLVEEPPVALNEGGLFRTGYNAELDDLRETRSGGKDWIASFQAAESERTGINSLKVGFNRVFGYYIEITKPNLHLAPPDYERKQTLANAERFTTAALKEQEAKVLGAEERIATLECQLFCELRDEVAGHTADLQQLASSLAEIDVLSALAEVGAARGYIIPELNEGLGLEIEGGRHPVLEALLPSGEFVSNDLSLNPEDARVVVITGPNMAGKSTYIRQCAILVILAQMGAPIPATRASIGLADRLFTRVGASDDLARGQSTFMVEMSEAANILNNATARSFIVLDEVGRGTSTFDGVSLAWAITEHLHNQVGARCLFATHYHELAELGVILPAVKNCNVAVRDWGGEIIFLRKIQPGSTDRSYGIQVARLAGIPKSVIQRARIILEGLEQQAQDRDRSYLGQTEALRAAARDIQLTLFDDPHRDAICLELAALRGDKLKPEQALETLRSFIEKAKRWRDLAK